MYTSYISASTFFWICVAGGIGSGFRYLLSASLLRIVGENFPYTTLVVNVLGSFLLSFLLELSLFADALSATWRMILGIGLLGGFTTYSSFNYQTLYYFQKGDWFIGAMNIFTMVLTCLIAGVIGFALAKYLGA